MSELSNDLSDENDDGIFTGSITGFTKNAYVFKFTTRDFLSNSYENETLFTINFAPTNSAGQSWIISGIFFMTLAIPVIIKEAKKK